MARPSELTRHSLIEAATEVFAEHGYEAGSVRLITQRAKANQAAIAYHFGGKDGLYREVLKNARHMVDEYRLLDEDEVDRLEPGEALRLYLRQHLLPLVERGRISRYARIFAWESVRPSLVFRDFIAREPPPMFVLAGRVVRRFLPADASEAEVAITTHWLVQQPLAFVRDADFLSRPPFLLAFDPAFVDQLAVTLTRLALAGLTGGVAARPEAGLAKAALLR
jgi:AcrR family transcriptional regulator